MGGGEGEDEADMLASTDEEVGGVHGAAHWRMAAIASARQKRKWLRCESAPWQVAESGFAASHPPFW